MRNKYMLIGVGIAVGVLLSSAVFVLAGNPDSPDVPGNTQSFTLEDIWNRLDSGAAGAQSTFTEPGVAPGTGTMHTLNEIMAKAPARDDANGATTGEVENGKTFWGLNVAGGEWGLQTGTAAAGGGAGVPKTGDAYNDACCTGEDGELQKGVAWPNPRFTDNANGTVTDNLTGLIWLKNANCAAATRNWQTALNDVVQLNTNGQMNSNNCGDTSNGGSHQTDWRLPNVRELQSLVHYGVYNPAVPNTAGTGKWTSNDPFTGVQSYYYWSSTTHAGTSDGAWHVNLGGGYVFYGGKAGICYAWPVRGGQ